MDAYIESFLPQAGSVSNLRQLFSFTVRRELTSTEKEAFYGLSGAKVRRNCVVTSPVHLARRIAEALDGLGLLADISIQGRLDVSVEQAEAAVRRSELREGMWDDWYRPFQREAVLWALMAGSGHLWHSPGAGKTASAVAWALAAPGPVVACTKAGIRLHWGREVQKVSGIIPWVSDPAARTRKGWVPPEEYLDTCHREGRRPFFIVGWEELSGLVFGDAASMKGNSAAGFLKHLEFASWILDECHTVKSRKRKKWTVLENGQWKGESLDNRVAAAAYLSQKAQRRLGTTGTPIPDRVRDLWGQLDLVEPGAWGGYYKWAHRFCAARPGSYGGLDDTGSSRLPELKDRLEFVRHRVPVEVSHGELPEKRREVIYIPKDRLSRSGKGALGAVKSAPDAETRLEAMLRLACSRKRGEVVEQTIDAVRGGSKVVIFTGRRLDCDALYESLTKKLKKHRTWIAHGGISSGDRDARRLEYMAEQRGCVMVATGESMGEGIDMQDTDLAIMAMLPWTPRAVGQWEARFHRPGMTRPVVVRYLIAEGTVDEHVCEILLGKLPAVASIVGDSGMESASRDLKGLGNRDEILGKLASRLKLRKA